MNPFRDSKLLMIRNSFNSACQMLVLVMAFLIWTMRVSFLSLTSDNATTMTRKLVSDEKPNGSRVSVDEEDGDSTMT